MFAVVHGACTSTACKERVEGLLCKCGGLLDAKWDGRCLTCSRSLLGCR